MDDIAKALVKMAEILNKGSKTAARRRWSPGMMKEWIKEVKKPLRELGHLWKKASSAVMSVERTLDDRQIVYTSLLDARDELDKFIDMAHTARNKIDGALQYVDMAEE